MGYMKDEKADSGVLALFMIFVVLTSLVAYYTVGIYNDDNSDYNDPIHDWDMDKQTKFTPTNKTPTFEAEWWQYLLTPLVIWEGIDYYFEWKDYNEDGEYTEGDSFDMVTGFTGMVGNIVTLNITPLNDLGLIGIALKIMAWVILIYIFLKLLPFVG